MKSTELLLDRLVGRFIAIPEFLSISFRNELISLQHSLIKVKTLLDSPLLHWHRLLERSKSDQNSLGQFNATAIRSNALKYESTSDSRNGGTNAMCLLMSKAGVEKMLWLSGGGVEATLALLSSSRALIWRCIACTSSYLFLVSTSFIWRAKWRSSVDILPTKGSMTGSGSMQAPSTPETFHPFRSWVKFSGTSTCLI